jgi:hypothetical protein
MKLERRHRLAFLLIFCLAWYLWQDRNTPAPAPNQAVVKARAPEPSVPHDTDADIREREALARMELEKEKRDLAASKSIAVRAKLQAACQDSWSKVLAANDHAFQALREQAKRSPAEETPCTLCDGKGYMRFCLVCRNNSGTCPACGGAGRDAFGGPCPACLGTRKCFSCFGSGKMLCPFCNDGTISAKGPLPPRTMPVH